VLGDELRKGALAAFLAGTKTFRDRIDLGFTPKTLNIERGRE
jgi:hypothetical protein